MDLALFDFDGTITTHDSFRDFLIFTFGKKLFARRILRVLPWLVGFSSGIVSRQTAKETVCRAFFTNMKVAQFNEIAQRFCDEKLENIIRSSAIKKLQWHKSMGHRIVLVSASLADYLQFWCDKHQIELLSTRLEQRQGILTGRFATPNCWGPEKVNRIRSLLNVEEYERIYAYGDSRGDKEMLGMADVKGYRVFS